MELSYDCQKNFEKVKFLLVDCDILVYYNLGLPIIQMMHQIMMLVLSYHILYLIDSKNLMPLFLSSSEHNYSQVDKEALSLIFGIIKFHKFSYGWYFTILN